MRSKSPVPAATASHSSAQSTTSRPRQQKRATQLVTTEPFTSWLISDYEEHVWARLMRPKLCARVLSAMEQLGTFTVPSLIEKIFLISHSDMETCLVRLTLSLWNLGIVSAVCGVPSSLEDAVWQWNEMNSKLPNYLHLPHAPEDPKTLEGPF